MRYLREDKYHYPVSVATVPENTAQRFESVKLSVA